MIDKHDMNPGKRRKYDDPCIANRSDTPTRRNVEGLLTRSRSASRGVCMQILSGLGLSMVSFSMILFMG